MDTSNFFQGNWLRGEHLKGRQVSATIEKVTLETIKDKDGKESQKIAVHFARVPKPLILNKTNYLAIVAASGGKDSDLWVGKKFILYTENIVAFGGPQVALRLRPAPPAAAPAPASASSPAPAPASAEEDPLWAVANAPETETELSF